MNNKVKVALIVAVGLTLGLSLGAVVRNLLANVGQPWELQISDVEDPVFVEPLRSLDAREKQEGLDGRKYVIDDPKDVSGTGVTQDDGRLLYSICRTLKPKNTLETGFARGVSTLYILAALKANGFGNHTAIDPFERSDWHGIGLKKVAETHSDDRFYFIDAPSIGAFGQLSDKKFDFIFIDGSHLFDDALLDFRLADLHCSEHCVIAIHDAVFLDAVKKAIVFIERDRPDYVRLKSPRETTAIFRRVGPDKRAWNDYRSF